MCLNTFVVFAHVDVGCLHHADHAKEYIPTVFDSYSVNVSLGEIDFQIGLFDTAGQEDYDQLRPLSYPEANIVMLCFGIESQRSLDSVREKVRLARQLDFLGPTFMLTHHATSGILKYCNTVHMFPECLLA